MKVYEFGNPNNPVFLLLPGTCCHWKCNFGHVIDGLTEHFRVAIVSYDGFDETESTTFVSMLDETEKIESYIQENYNGCIHAAYGCSLGGSFVALLINRRNIHITHGIIGSSDMDQMPKWLAKTVTAAFMPMVYPLITGKGSFIKTLVDKKTERHPEDAEYRQKFMDMMGMGKMDFSFLSKESVKNQFCTDLYTPVGENVSVPGTTIHVFYAKKMGEKYLARYKKHFAEPDIIEFDLQHEELLLDAPRWINEVVKVCGVSEKVR